MVLSNLVSMYQESSEEFLDYAFFKSSNFEKWLESEKGKKIKDNFDKIYENLFSNGGTKNSIKDLIEIFKTKRNIQIKKEKFLGRHLKLKFNDEYEKLNEEEKVKLWTDYFEPQLSKSESKEGIKNFEDWLTIVMRSSEFAKEMENKSCYSIFSSSLLYDNKTRVEARKAIETALEKAEKQDIVNQIISAINSELGSDRIHRESFSEIRTFDDFKMEIKKITKEQMNELGKKNLEVTINGQPAFLKINLAYEPGMLGKVKINNFLYKLSEASYLAINNLFNNESNEIILHIGSGEIIKIKKIKTFNLKNIFKVLKKHEEQINKIVIKNYGASSVRGFLGEFTRLFNKQKINLTGTTYDYIKRNNKKISLGESFSDANFEINNSKTNKNLKIGFNIKHYVSSFNQDSITLYSPKNQQEAVSIYQPYIRRYFPEKIVRQLQFIDMNIKLFRKNIKDTNYKKRISILSYKYLDTFTRIASEANNVNFTNYFFIINNRYIPTSYIYLKIIERLEQIKNKEKTSLFSIFGLPQPVREGDFPIKNMVIKDIKKKDPTSIKFSGITINGLKNF